MSKGIAVLGNAILDTYKEVDVYPEHSTLTTIRNIAYQPGGALCNCAQDLARLNPSLQVQVIGLVGQDDAGSKLVDTLSAYANIDLSQLRHQGQTSFTDVLIDLKNHTRTFFQFRGANALLDLDQVDWSRLDASILHAGYILLLDALDQSDPEYGTRMARLLARARKEGLKTSIDVVSEESDRFSRIVPPALRYTDYCIINEYEASRTAGIPVRNEQGVLQTEAVLDVCRAMFEMGVAEWVVIHSREGAVGLDCHGETVLLPALDLSGDTIVNTTGAGDAFLSGTLYGAWKGYSITQSVRLGIAAANRSLLYPSASEGITAEAELIRFYQSKQPEAWPGFPV